MDVAGLRVLKARPTAEQRSAIDTWAQELDGGTAQAVRSLLRVDWEGDLSGCSDLEMLRLVGVAFVVGDIAGSPDSTSRERYLAHVGALVDEYGLLMRDVVDLSRLTFELAQIP